ncbi:MAG: T9SS type A sorting domain-containing protein, partial [Crocinitomicaceae bacterium]|nr:T9SS type A sorting domain-containing protein [Crocinitomicaceae bacterium]
LNGISSSSTVSIQACDSLVSPSANYIWNTSGTYLDTIPNSAGCDSIITVNLTINNPTFSVQNFTACNSFVSPSTNYLWNASGTYQDTISNSAGCDSIITVNLIIESVDSSAVQNGLSISANQNGASYQWLDCLNGFSEIAGETNQTFTALNNGEYAVEVTLNSCVDTSVCFVIDDVSLAENARGSVRVFPNPNKGNFTVQMLPGIENATLKITDNLGKIVQQIHIDTSSQNIELNLPAGVYYLEFTSEELKENYTVIVQQ